MSAGRSIFNLLMVAAGLLLGCVAVQAGVIMPNKPILIGGVAPVEFDHVLHRSMEIHCGECHHDRKHNLRSEKEILGIADAKELDCNNCHNKDFENPFLQNREDLFHTNCQPCHAVGIDGVRGPRKCDGCHKTKK